MVQSAEMQQSEKLEDESLVPHWLQAFGFAKELLLASARLTKLVNRLISLSKLESTGFFHCDFGVAYGNRIRHTALV